MTSLINKAFFVNALQNISNCLKLRKTFTVESIENFLKKEGVSLENLEVRIDSVESYMEWLFNYAKESNDLEIRNEAQKTIEKLKTDKFIVSDRVKSLWVDFLFTNSEQAKLSVKTGDRSEDSLKTEDKSDQRREAKDFIGKVLKNLEYNVINQQKFNQLSLDNFINKSDNRELAGKFDIGVDSTDYYLETAFKLIENIDDTNLNNTAFKVVRWLQQREISIPETVWEKWYLETFDDDLQVTESGSDESSKNEANKALLTTLCSLTKQMSVNKPIRIETLRTSSQDVTEWFERFESQTVKWDSDDRASQVVSFFEDMAFEKYKIMTDGKNDFTRIKQHNINLYNF
ncbi:unnamed protein product [Brachionus calyciflorus]|uniref:Uncharacterized protein n=1 Tax=Brachionus calyciflorus TaxID=104777 RepID=A0A814H357_9BILA|nr:unnamed protein product [Brachionus calyciflorus]